jgi:hypothetical protein
VTKRHKSIRRRAEKIGVELTLLIGQAEDFDIKGVLPFNEITPNSHLAFYLNRHTIKVGQHLNCVILEDLINLENEASLRLSLNNQKISGKPQLAAALLTKPELSNFEPDDDTFVVLGRNS